jgi:putative flavoprotein involved in K+ transport
VFDSQGDVGHERGVSAIPGLYFLGLPWQHTRGSALLGWVKDDAEYIARQVAAFRPNAPAGTRVPERGRNAGRTPVGAA